MAIVLSLIALLTAFTGGLGAVALLSPKSKISRCERSGTAALLGAGIVSVLSFCLGPLIQGAPLRWTITAICIGLPVLALIRRHEPLFQGFRLRFDIVYLCLTVLVIAQVLLVVWLSLYRSTLGWDGLFNWEIKARIAFTNHGVIPLSFYTDDYRIAHPTYPLFLPLLQAWIYEWLGRIDQSVVKLIGPYFYLAALLLLIGSTRRVTNNRWAAVVAILLFGSIPALTLDTGAVSGYADFPLAVMWLCAAVHCLEYWRTGSIGAARLAGAGAMLLPFIKPDGAVGLLCIAIAVIPKVVRERNWAAGAWMIAPGVAMSLGWAAFLKFTHVPPNNDLFPMTPSNFIAHVNRAPDLLRWALQELTTWRHWSLLWPLAVAAAAIRAIPFRMARSYPLTANVIPPLILYPAVFFFSAWNPVEPHVLSALPRLLIQGAGPAVLLVAVALGELLGEERPRPARHRVVVPRVEHGRDAVEDVDEAVVGKAAGTPRTRKRPKRNRTKPRQRKR